MTIGSDQLDAWGRTLIECDELFREVQLLVRINPEAYNVDSDAITITATANADAWDDGGLVHPIAFARRWAWHLAAENRSIPPITNKWVTLIRYVSAHLQYLSRDDREWFADELRQLRGLLGALVNENGLSIGEEELLRMTRKREAGRRLREWAATSDRPMRRSELAIIFPTMTQKEWTRARVRKFRLPDPTPAYHYPANLVAAIAPAVTDPPLSGLKESGEDVYDDWDRYVSLDQLIEQGLL